MIVLCEHCGSRLALHGCDMTGERVATIAEVQHRAQQMLREWHQDDERRRALTLDARFATFCARLEAAIARRRAGARDEPKSARRNGAPS